MLPINLTIQYIAPPLPCSFNTLTNIPNRDEGWVGVNLKVSTKKHCLYKHFLLNFIFQSFKIFAPNFTPSPLHVIRTTAMN